MVEFYSSDLPKKKSKYSHKVLSNTQKLFINISNQ